MARRYDVTPHPRGLLRRDAEVRPGRPRATPGPRSTASAPGRRPREWRARVAFGTVARPAGAQGARGPRPDPDLGHRPLRELRAARPLRSWATATRSSSPSNRRAESATDLINVGGENHAVLRPRAPCPPRAATSASGWRHRWPGLEAGGGVPLDASPTATTRRPDRSRTPRANLFGGEAEVRWRCGGWTLLLHGEGMWGNLDVHRESLPDFADRDSSLPALASRRCALGVGYSWPKTDLFLTSTYDRQHLPFVSLAVLGTETVGVRPRLRSRFARTTSSTSTSRSATRSRRRSACAWACVVAWGAETDLLHDCDGRAARPRRSTSPARDLRRRALGPRSARPKRPSSSARTSRSARRADLRPVQPAKIAREEDTRAPSGIRPHLRLEPRRRRRVSRPRQGRARRRDAARRPPVAVGQEPVDRRRRSSILHLMEALGIDSADIGLPGAGPHVVATVTRLAQEIVDAKMKIRPNCAARTVAADILPIIEISQKVGIPIEVSCFIGSSPIRQYAEDWDFDRMLRALRGRRLARRQGRPAGHVRHRGHDARAPGPHPADVHDGDPRGRQARLRLRHGRPRDARRRAQPRPVRRGSGRGASTPR